MVYGSFRGKRSVRGFGSIVGSSPDQSQSIQVFCWDHYLGLHQGQIFPYKHPYKNRVSFWENLFASGIFDIEHLMIAGGLNVTLSSDECWGSCRKKDPLAECIKFKLLNKNLVDITPTEMKPTWDNGRTEKAYIAKRIDRFIVHVSIIDNLGMPFSIVGNAFVSNHRSILLSWREKGFRKGYPFKFNRTYLEDPAFNDLITNAWKDLLSKAMSPPFLTFRDKMAIVRKLVKDWQIEKRKKDRQELQAAQQELDNFLKSSDASSCPFRMKCRIRELERKKYKLLKQEESFWRLKSRAIWLKEGDRNTNFFHKHANAKREKNTIWKIRDGNGGFFVSQQDITREAVSHFKSQYRRRKDGPLQDILWGIELVPQMFDDEKNEALFQPVTENELLGILKAFKKDKFQGLDGWTIEFFTHFF